MFINYIIVLRPANVEIMETITALVKSPVCIYTHVITISENGSNRSMQPLYICIAARRKYRFKCFTTKSPHQ